MKALAISISLCFILLTSCDTSTPLNDALLTALDGCEEIIINDDNDVFPDDPLFIQDAVVNNNTLQLTVQYGGGCGDVEFKLIGDALFMESNPVQSPIALSLKDKDWCKALITTELCYDLSALATLYRNSYQTSSGTIILRIEGFEPLVYYSF
jgi:hypothetical protein